MPAEGVELINHDDILSFEEIIEVVKHSIDKGITKFRLTGGEPLVRKDIILLVSMIARIKGIEDLAMTTNGILLAPMAKALKDAGLRRLNISLDTLDPVKYKELTRGGELAAVLQGIKAARHAGFEPIKINCVVTRSSMEPDALAVKKYALENRLRVRFIHQMDLTTGKFSKVEGGEGGNCTSCNRVRLMANGGIKPCLFNDSCFNIKEYGIEEALKKAIEAKPSSGTKNHSGKFYYLGG
jgi:cyclic pyranopterin phosphate synthase